MANSPRPASSAEFSDAKLASLAAEKSADVCMRLSSRESGLSHAEVVERQARVGKNELLRKRRNHIAVRFLLQFGNPLVALLVIIGVFSLSFGDSLSAIMVWLMAFLSVCLSFFQEERADHAVEALQAMVRTMVRVRREAKDIDLPLAEIVPGDIVLLQAGDLVPADLRIIKEKDLSLNESSLTGESLPVEKLAEHPQKSPDRLLEQKTLLFLGTSVVSGTAEAIVVRTGKHTTMGQLSFHVQGTRARSSFDTGIRDLTWLILRVIAVLVVIIFLARLFFQGSASTVESLLFALAVAVGLTPDMLPMIVTITLSRGALDMAKKQVIVKHLPAIQDFGAMDILCTDKTGTLTLDKVVLERYCDLEGKENPEVLRYAFLNSFFQSGLRGLLDRTIVEHEHLTCKECTKIDEIPFDFERRIMSVVVDQSHERTLVSKGAPESVLSRCSHYALGGQIHPIERGHAEELLRQEEVLSKQGFRVLAVAAKTVASDRTVFTKEDETGLTLYGYLAFLDPPKPSAKQTILSLRQLGVVVKVLTGDHPAVTRKVCSDVGLNIDHLLTGDEVDAMSDAQLSDAVLQTSIFARLSPFQKERVVRMLRSKGHVVGYLGDGINDAPSLKAADIGISVQNAVDIAKESADVILLQKSLQVLCDGIFEGRKIFENIQKYVRMGLSSNFGNMFSMTGAALLLPFLPMLPLQILLTNFLYNFSQLTIATDDVDVDELKKPRPWDLPSLRRFMFVFGPVSSLFDFLTFGVLIFVFHASPPVFQTSWFLTSLCTQTLVIHIIRTQKLPFIQSRPSTLLLLSSLTLTAFGLLLPLLPVARTFGLVHVQWPLLLTLMGIVTLYLGTVQIVKMWYVKKFGYG